MPLVLPTQGLPDMLAWMLRTTTPVAPDLVMTLWTNDITPDPATVFADLVRASFTGFFEVTMTRGVWTAPVAGTDYAVSSWGTVPTEWTAGVAVPAIYGWAAYNPGPLRLCIVERFDTPRALNAGDKIGVLPFFNLGTYVPCP